MTSLSRSQANVVRLVWMLVAAVLALMAIFPLLYMLSIAFKGPTEVFKSNLIPTKPVLDNFIYVLTEVPFWRYLINTFVISAVVTVVALFFHTMAGYALARLKFRGRRFAGVIFASSILVPFEAILISLFLVMRGLELNNTLTAVVLPGAIAPLNILLLRNAFLALPAEVEEAAVIDGANAWQRFTRLALPSVKGTLVVVALFSFMFSWDDFLWPLVVLSDQSKYTLTIGLAYLQGTFVQNQRLVAAGTIIAVLPLILLFLLLQKHFFRGVGEGAIKG